MQSCMVLSQPCEVIFAGFRSDTYRLQQAGWVLSVEQDIMRCSLRLAMKLPAAGLYMLAEQVDFDFYQRAHLGGGASPRFIIRHCSSQIHLRLQERSFAFQPIDATPVFVDAPFKSIEDYGIFATPLVRTEEILVEPESVEECMALIRKLQAPELEAVRKRNAQRARDPGSTEHGAMQRTNFHAQIITLAA